MSPRTSGGLSVKGVAEVAGVTPRTVRYYHSIGLLPEPPRDASGYRRYSGADVVALVRVTRLRALGMSLEQVAERIADPEPDVDGDADGATDDRPMTEALGALADELDAEIDRLVARRDRLRALAASEGFVRPVEALTHALRDQGVLRPGDRLRSGEKWAAAVLDALHPEGMPGLLAQASAILGDSTVVAALRPLRRRLRQLNEQSTDAEIAALAVDVAAVLPPAGVDGQVDLGLVDLVLTDRLNPTQQRFVRELRTHLKDAP